MPLSIAGRPTGDEFLGSRLLCDILIVIQNLKKYIYDISLMCMWFFFD